MPARRISFKSPRYLIGTHMETMIPSLFRRVKGVNYQRERLELNDGDFIDLDISPAQSKKVAIISHGVFGSSSRHYVQGMVKSLNKSGWDAIAWNYRSCSEQPNRKKQLYHAGSSNDLSAVVDFALKVKKYEEIALIGFSLGGNITLNYLRSKNLPKAITKSIAISTPCDLHHAASVKKSFANSFYVGQFIRNFKKKILLKSAQFPDYLQIEWKKIKTLKDFDDLFTAPLHGFKDAMDYYQSCSIHNEIDKIKTKTLIINAENDPFLSPSCFPIHACEKSAYVTLEIPSTGGHVGFVSTGLNKETWAEQRTIHFLQEA